MASSTLMVAGMVVLVVAAGLAVSSSADDETEQCMSLTFNAAMGCQNVNTEGFVPDSSCCEGLKELKENAAFCFCAFLLDCTNSSSAWYTPNYGKLLQATETCGIPQGVSDCPGILGMPADSPDAVVFKGQEPAASINLASPPSLDGIEPTFSSSSLPFGLAPEAATTQSDGTTKSDGVIVRIFKLGTVVSSMGVAAWILA